MYSAGMEACEQHCNRCDVCNPGHLGRFLCDIWLVGDSNNALHWNGASFDVWRCRLEQVGCIAGCMVVLDLSGQ